MSCHMIHGQLQYKYNNDLDQSYLFTVELSNNNMIKEGEQNCMEKCKMVWCLQMLKKGNNFSSCLHKVNVPISSNFSNS